MLIILHNHRIHYKDLLFNAMHERTDDFVVLFSGCSANNRLNGNIQREMSYRHEFLYEGSYSKVRQLWTVGKTLRRLRYWKPKCLVISGWYDLNCWVTWAFAQCAGIPMILWAESNSGDRPRNVLFESIKKLFVSKFAAAHVYGGSNKKYLMMLGMSAERIFIKRAVLDTELFLAARKTWTQPRGEVRKLIYIGRLSTEKNLESVLHAMVLLPKGDLDRLEFQIVGYGRLEQSLRETAAALGIEGSVKFLGSRLQAEIPEILCRADCLILPSTSEPWGLVVAEAMAVGLPVIVSDVCGCAEDLVDESVGWVYPPKDIDTLASILTAFVRMPLETLECMGFLARAIASQYSAQNCANIVVQSIKSVTGQII